MKNDTFDIIVYYPTDKKTLSDRIAAAHADMVTNYINKLNCSPEQKTTLADAVINTAKNLER